MSLGCAVSFLILMICCLIFFINLLSKKNVRKVFAVTRKRIAVFFRNFFSCNMHKT